MLKSCRPDFGLWPKYRAGGRELKIEVVEFEAVPKGIRTRNPSIFSHLLVAVGCPPSAVCTLFALLVATKAVISYPPIDANPCEWSRQMHECWARLSRDKSVQPKLGFIEHTS